MDRPIFYRDEVSSEADVLVIARFAMEGLGLAMMDLVGEGTVVAGLPCTPTSPASMNVVVGAGRIYQKELLDPEDYGTRLGTGGIEADTDPDHSILKQGLLRDPVTFAITAPPTSGHSRVTLIQARFEEVDDAAEPASFYNTANPNAPISAEVSKFRRAKCVLSAKNGTSATTGTQTAPTADAGNVPVWLITVANGQTTITAPNIVQSPSAPLIDVGGGGGGGGTGLSAWVAVNANATMVNGGRYLADTTGGTFTLNVPAAPAAGAEVWIKVNGATNKLIVGRNGQTIAGSATNLDLDEDYITAHLVFDGTTWRV